MDIRTIRREALKTGLVAEFRQHATEFTDAANAEEWRVALSEGKIAVALLQEITQLTRERKRKHEIEKTETADSKKPARSSKSPTKKDDPFA